MHVPVNEYEVAPFGETEEERELRESMERSRREAELTSRSNRVLEGGLGAGAGVVGGLMLDEPYANAEGKQFPQLVGPQEDPLFDRFSHGNDHKGRRLPIPGMVTGIPEIQGPQLPQLPQTRAIPPQPKREPLQKSPPQGLVGSANLRQRRREREREKSRGNPFDRKGIPPIVGLR